MFIELKFRLRDYKHVYTDYLDVSKVTHVHGNSIFIDGVEYKLIQISMADYGSYLMSEGLI